MHAVYDSTFTIELTLNTKTELNCNTTAYQLMSLMNLIDYSYISIKPHKTCYIMHSKKADFHNNKAF